MEQQKKNKKRFLHAECTIMRTAIIWFIIYYWNFLLDFSQKMFSVVYQKRNIWIPIVHIQRLLLCSSIPSKTRESHPMHSKRRNKKKIDALNRYAVVHELFWKLACCIKPNVLSHAIHQLMDSQKFSFSISFQPLSTSDRFFEWPVIWPLVTHFYEYFQFVWGKQHQLIMHELASTFKQIIINVTKAW